MVLLYFFVFIFILFYCEPHDAQTFQSRGQLLLLNLLRYRNFVQRSLLLVNLLRHRCYGVEVYLFSFYFWDGKQNFIPNVWQLVLANVSIEGRVIDSDVYSYLYGPCHILTLPSYNFEVFHCCCVTSNIMMFKNW